MNCAARESAFCSRQKPPELVATPPLNTLVTLAVLLPKTIQRPAGSVSDTIVYGVRFTVMLTTDELAAYKPLGSPPVPAGPCGPIGPMSPCGPCGPISPWAPGAPFVPLVPFAPAGPAGP